MMILDDHIHQLLNMDCYHFDPRIKPSANKALMYHASRNRPDIAFADTC
jgi:hypothetical protein